MEALSRFCICRKISMFHVQVQCNLLAHMTIGFVSTVWMHDWEHAVLIICTQAFTSLQYEQTLKWKCWAFPVKSQGGCFLNRGIRTHQLVYKGQTLVHRDYYKHIHAHTHTHMHEHAHTLFTWVQWADGTQSLSLQHQAHGKQGAKTEWFNYQWAGKNAALNTHHSTTLCSLFSTLSSK